MTPRERFIRDFDTFLGNAGIEHFSAVEPAGGLCNPGRKSSAGVPLSIPPEDLWPNIVPTAMVLEWVRGRIGVPVNVTNGYRDLRYNRSVGSSDGGMHPRFNAADFFTRHVSAREIALLLHTEHPQRHALGIGLYRTFVHVDTRGLRIRDLARNSRGRYIDDAGEIRRFKAPARWWGSGVGRWWT